MEIEVGKYTLENDKECKAIPDGYEIFSPAVERYGINPSDFTQADWGAYGSIIVYAE